MRAIDVKVNVNYKGNELVYVYLVICNWLLQCRRFAVPFETFVG